MFTPDPTDPTRGACSGPWTEAERDAEVARIEAIVAAMLDEDYGNSHAAQAMAICVLKCTTPDMCVVLTEEGREILMGLSTIPFVLGQIDMEPDFNDNDRAELKAKIGAPLAHPNARRIIFRFETGVVMCRDAGVRFQSKGGSA